MNWQKGSPELLTAAKKIKVLLMDVDGVMTDGKLYYFPGPDGLMVETKGFNSHDGVGLFMCFQAGILTGVISGRQSPATVERARILNMRFVYQGLLDKIGAFEEILREAKVTADEVAFVGDDFPDVPLMRRSGLGVAVANARPEVKAAANYVCDTVGGEGAIREVAELILKSQNLFDMASEKYLQEQSLVK